MIDFYTLITILFMAVATYSTRVTGYLLLKNRTLNPKLTKVLEATPGCVLIAVLAPAFATTQPANLITLVITVLAASRLSILPTVIISIAAAAILRHYIPL